MEQSDAQQSWLKMIASHPYSADLLLNALAAAAQSYRRATVCVPFPKAFEVNGVRDYTALQQTLDSLPSIATFPETLNLLSTQHNFLLEWTLNSHPRRKASAFEIIAYDTFLNEVPQARLTAPYASNPSLRPHAVFKLRPEAQSNVAVSAENLQRKSTESTLIAFHGTSFENMHSILRSGLVPASGTRLERTGAAFGSGIYMTTELPVAYSFCSSAFRWKHSALAPEGTLLRCVLVCEAPKSAAGSGSDGSSMTTSASGNQVPEQYLVIDRPDLVKVRYLLLYLDIDPKHRGAVGGQKTSTQQSSPLLRWLLMLGIVYIVWLAWGFVCMKWPLVSRTVRRQLGLNIL